MGDEINKEDEAVEEVTVDEAEVVTDEDVEVDAEDVEVAADKDVEVATEDVTAADEAEVAEDAAAAAADEAEVAEDTAADEAEVAEVEVVGEVQKTPSAARTRPLFKRSYKSWVVIRPVKVDGKVRERGYEFELSAVRPHILRSYYLRRRVGPAGHAWTENEIVRIEHRIAAQIQHAEDQMLANKEALIADAGAKVETAEDAAQVAEDAADDAVELVNKLSVAEASQEDKDDGGQLQED